MHAKRIKKVIISAAVIGTIAAGAAVPLAAVAAAPVASSTSSDMIVHNG